MGGSGPKEITDRWSKEHNHDEDVTHHLHNHAKGHDSVPSQDEAK